MSSKNCPKCRGLLSKTHSQSVICKRCGYQQKNLKIVEENQEYSSRINYSSRIYNGKHQYDVKLKNVPTSKKLEIYLFHYQKLLKLSLQKLLSTIALPRNIQAQLAQQLKQIWFTYLKKMTQEKKQISGMFKRMIYQKTQNKKVIQIKKIIQQKNQQQNQSENFEVQQQYQKIQQLNQHQQQQNEQIQKRKRGRPKRCQQSLEKVQKKQKLFNQMEQRFASYYNKHIKTKLINTIRQQKNEINQSKLLFLQYIFNIKKQQNISEQFIDFISYKYIKLLLDTRRRTLLTSKSYIRDKQIALLLQERKQAGFKKRQQCLSFILLIDLLHYWAIKQSTTLLNQQFSCKLVLDEYQQNANKNHMIDVLLEYLLKPQANNQQNMTIPQPSYMMIYSFIYLTACRRSQTITISQIVVCCGKIQMEKIQLSSEYQIGQLPTINNQESINAIKIRKIAHLLIAFMDLKIPQCIEKWSFKWSQKLGLMHFSSQINIINKLLFEQSLTKQKSPYHQREYNCFINQVQILKRQKYHRYITIQQDIATLSAIIIFLKLRVGLSHQYPYLMNINFVELQKRYVIQTQSYKSIKQLLCSQNGISYTNKFTGQLITEQITQKYRQVFQIKEFVKRLTEIKNKDVYFGHFALEKSNNKQHNLSDISGISAQNLIKIFLIKDENDNTQLRKSDKILLKFNDRMVSQQNNNKKKEDAYKKQIKNKQLQIKKQSKYSQYKLKVDLNQNIIKQFQCIVQNIKQGQLIQNNKGQIIRNAVLDEPSINYELMYDYSYDILKQAKRQQLFYILDTLCFNLCYFNQLAGWLTRYQYYLKEYE